MNTYPCISGCPLSTIQCDQYYCILKVGRNAKIIQCPTCPGLHVKLRRLNVSCTTLHGKNITLATFAHSLPSCCHRLTQRTIQSKPHTKRATPTHTYVCNTIVIMHNSTFFVDAGHLISLKIERTILYLTPHTRVQYITRVEHYRVYGRQASY